MQKKKYSKIKETDEDKIKSYYEIIKFLYMSEPHKILSSQLDKIINLRKKYGFFIGGLYSSNKKIKVKRDVFINGLVKHCEFLINFLNQEKSKKGVKSHKLQELEKDNKSIFVIQYLILHASNEISTRAELDLDFFCQQAAIDFYEQEKGYWESFVGDSHPPSSLRAEITQALFVFPLKQQGHQGFVEKWPDLAQQQHALEDRQK